ncbi:hypothetical protein AVJ23_03800 [Pseudoponticoccus marisrubri]|uniref:Uncharacterized protein n=1 Tax=Pseudoponticoccus marisrubri TaxID=1685382 RepID=A0A0W7WMG5_9RHOB|nr:hypothetical protein AVJ23_03800 [Pseudoponticoccus marisrubri]
MDYATRVTITNATGGSFYPLRHGKVLTWSEEWDWDDEPDIEDTYRMRVEQRCCTVLHNTPSDRHLVWEIDYSFESEDHVSEATLLFDPSLGWSLRMRQEQTIRDGDTTDRTVYYERFSNIRPRE